MKNTTAVVATVSIAFLIAIGAMAGPAAHAAGPAPVNLGAAANFSVLGASAVTNTGSTTTDRDVGVSPGTSVSGFPPGVIGGTRHENDTAAGDAQNDLTAAYTIAANAPSTASHTALGGLTLVGGVYDSGGATMNLTGTLTLDGQHDPGSVWIFKASSDLITASSSRVSFINGASPCNVFWQVTSSATLGSGSTFVGTIMALASVTSDGNVTVYGRALARTATVTLIGDRFLTLACAGGATVPIPPTRPPFTVAPSTTPAVVPTSTPIGAASATPTTSGSPVAAASPSAAPAATSVAATSPTAAPAAASAAAAAVAGTNTLPSTSTGDPFAPLAMLGIALTGIGTLLLVRRPIRHL